MEEQAKEISGVPFIYEKTNSIKRPSPLKPKNFPKAPCPNTITLTIRFHHTDFGRTQTFSPSVQFSVRLLATPWITAHQASLFMTNSPSLPKLMSIESVMPSNHLSLCRPLLLLPQSFPASESFPMSQLFAWGGQSTGVSALASVLPKKFLALVNFFNFF